MKLKKSVISFILLVIIPFLLNGTEVSKQNIEKFAEFLYKSGDYSRASYEYMRILHLFENTDAEILELNLKIGKCFSFLNKYENAEKFFNLCLLSRPGVAIYDEALVHMGFLFFKQGQYDRSSSLLIDSQSAPDHRLINTMILANSLCKGDPEKARTIIDTFKREGRPYIQVFNRYSDILFNIKKKSPLKAAIMSTILPGSGRIYSGRVKEGLISMVSFFATSYLAYEGFRDRGIKSFKGWLFSSIGAFLYIGNIYGSVVSARITNQKIDDSFKKGIEISLKFYFND